MSRYLFRTYFYSDPASPHLRVLSSEDAFEAPDEISAVERAKILFDEAICICDHVTIVGADDKLIWEDGLRELDGSFSPSVS